MIPDIDAAIGDDGGTHTVSAHGIRPENFLSGNDAIAIGIGLRQREQVSFNIEEDFSVADGR